MEVAAAPMDETGKELGTGGSVIKENETLEVTAPVLAPPVTHIVWKVMKKVLKIPNTYASFLGLIWSLIAFKFVIPFGRYGLQLSVSNCVAISLLFFLTFSL